MFLTRLSKYRKQSSRSPFGKNLLTGAEAGASLERFRIRVAHKPT
jgi:hypothetical protein